MRMDALRKIGSGWHTRSGVFNRTARACIKTLGWDRHQKCSRISAPRSPGTRSAAKRLREVVGVIRIAMVELVGHPVLIVYLQHIAADQVVGKLDPLEAVVH